MDWCYIAGFFDGEGSVIFSKPKPSTKWNPTVQLVFSNTNKSLLDAIQERLECGKVYLIAKKGYRSYARSDYWQLRIARHEDVAKVAKMLLAYCVLKKEKLARAIEYIRLTPWTYSYQRRRLWSSEELAYLKAVYPHTARKEVMKQLAPRSWLSIRNKAFSLGIHRPVKMLHIHGHFSGAEPIAKDMGVEVKTG